MALQKQNVIVGAARVFIGPALDSVANLATWRPAVNDGPPIVSYATTVEADVDWTEVGFTQDGLEVAYNPEYGEVEVDQYLDTPRMFKQSMSVSLNTTFAEATLANLLVTWGQAEDTLSGSELTMEGGRLGEFPQERGLIAVGNGPEDFPNGYTERTYFAYRALSVEATSHALRRNEATVFPVSFRALPLDDAGVAKYGSVRDRVLV